MTMKIDVDQQLATQLQQTTTITTMRYIFHRTECILHRHRSIELMQHGPVDAGSNTIVERAVQQCMLMCLILTCLTAWWMRTERRGRRCSAGLLVMLPLLL